MSGNTVSYDLYGFRDASTRANVAVVYLVLKTEEDTFIRLVAAKITIIHDWLSALDRGLEVCVVSFNVKKAFDYSTYSLTGKVF